MSLLCTGQPGAAQRVTEELRAELEHYPELAPQLGPAPGPIRVTIHAGGQATVTSEEVYLVQGVGATGYLVRLGLAQELGDTAVDVDEWDQPVCELAVVGRYVSVACISEIVGGIPDLNAAREKQEEKQHQQRLVKSLQSAGFAL